MLARHFLFHRFLFVRPLALQYPTTITPISSTISIQQQHAFHQHLKLEAKRKKPKQDFDEEDLEEDEEDKNQQEENIQINLKDLDTEMKKFIEQFKKNLAQVNTGRASPSLIENIKVKLANNDVLPLKQLGNIVVKNSRLLAVTVFEQPNINLIEKAIREENLNLNPQSKHNVIEIPLPKMTKEVREGIVKQVKKFAELTKDNIRLIRRDALTLLKDKKKNAAKDEIFKQEKELQKLVDDNVKKVDELLVAKEKEIMATATE